MKHGQSTSFTAPELYKLQPVPQREREGKLTPEPVGQTVPISGGAERSRGQRTQLLPELVLDRAI